MSSSDFICSLLHIKRVVKVPVGRVLLENRHAHHRRKDARIEDRHLRSSILDLRLLRLCESNRGPSEAHLLGVKILQKLAALELVEKTRLGDIGGFEPAGA